MHYSVMLKECIENLKISKEKVYVDATMGYAGHTKEILKNLEFGVFYGFDQDKEAIDYCKNFLKDKYSNIEINYCHDNFKNLEKYVDKCDGILIDLGFSSPQIDNKERGFSFMQDGKIDMRMSQSGKSCKDIIDTYSIDELTKIFYEYAEEKKGRLIAKKIFENKENINTTLELVETIKNATGANYFFKNHPERKIFQALRIEVNEELEVLKEVLSSALKILNKGGRICIITFHSLEDRIVKNFFKEHSEVNEIVKGLPIIPEEFMPKLKIIKKVINPSNSELEENSRSRSAKLRVAERI